MRILGNLVVGALLISYCCIFANEMIDFICRCVFGQERWLLVCFDVDLNLSSLSFLLISLMGS